MSGLGAAEVLVLIVDAGAGHRSAANALVAASEAHGVPLEFRVESLQDILKPTDVFLKVFGRSVEDIYNWLIRSRRTRFLVALLRIFHVVIYLRRGALTRLIEERLRRRPPALVLSLAPNLNGVIRDAVRRAVPHTPFLILLTDYADFPPHFWIEPGVDGVIVGSEHAVSQARAMGLAQVFQVSGMLLHPRFYAPASDPSLLRGELGIPEGAFTLLVLFGGVGSAEVEPLCATLLEESSEWHVIAICGRNPALEGRLRTLAQGSGGRLHTVGFTDRVREFMESADLLLTKPGPGTIAEALHVRLPSVVACGVHTVPQERYNAHFLASEGLGLVVRNWRGFPAAVRELLKDGGARLRETQEALGRLPKNRAVFEVLEILQHAPPAGFGPAS